LASPPQFRAPESAAEGAASRPLVEPTAVKAWEYEVGVYIQKNRSAVEVICTPSVDSRAVNWKNNDEGV
jgi:hypothetical protein